MFLDMMDKEVKIVGWHLCHSGLYVTLFQTTELNFLFCSYVGFVLGVFIMGWNVPSLRSEVICEKFVRPSSMRVTLAEREQKYLRFEVRFALVRQIFWM